MTRSDPPGAAWHRCDLHVHTPWDSDRTFRENVKHAVEALEKHDSKKLAAIAERFVSACRSGAGGEGIDLVALTDHNSIEGYRVLKPFFDDIAQRAQQEGARTPTILPGVEFSVGGERPLHFLAIFASSTPPEQIDGAIRHVFGEREPFDPQTRKPRATGTSIDEFLKRLYAYCRPSSGDRALSFVLLPAHADRRRGIANETAATTPPIAPGLWDEMQGQLRQWAIARHDWHGFQTAHPYADLPQPFRELLAKWHAVRRGHDWNTLSGDERDRIFAMKHWPLVECSDPHQYEEIGSRYTWLKMETRDVEGIRLALLDPESRLRRMDEGPPANTHPHIQRVSIRGTDFFDDLDVPLNPYLNTIIGGRGTGKSTFLECIRFVLDRDRAEDIPDEKVYEAIRDRLTVKQQRDCAETPGVLVSGYQVELDLCISDQTYRVRRSEDGVTIDRDRPDSTGLQLDVRTLIQPRILSQRQIAAIASDPRAQLRELDALTDQDAQREFRERRQSLLDDIESLQTRRRQLVNAREEIPARETELQKVLDSIAILEQHSSSHTLDQFRSFQAEGQWLDDAVAQLRTHADTLTASAKGLADPDAPPDGPSRDWLESVVSRIRDKLEQVRQALQASASELNELVSEVDAERITTWQQGFARAKADYDELRADLKAKGVEFGQHEDLLRQRAALKADLKRLRAQAAEVVDVEKNIDERRDALIRTHLDRLQARRRLAQELENQDADVRIQIIPFGDDSHFRASRDTWFGGAGLPDSDWRVLADYVFDAGGDPAARLGDLVKALRKDVSKTREEGRALARDESATVTLLGPRGSRLSGHFFNALQNEDRIHLDELEHHLPEDLLEARVRGTDGSFKPIEQGSVGQRSTAILALLLSAGEQPLIIDQPEDDLDNHYVYDVVVDILRKRKFSRQIVIATHNANIPVNGDAELIVAFDVRDKLGEVRTSGSIDRADVKQAVAQIMEGSTEAFRLRRERYGY